MQFESLEALMAMNGYGAYVWSSYLVFAAVIAGLVLATRLEHRRIVLNQRRLARLELRNTGATKEQDEPGS